MSGKNQSDTRGSYQRWVITVAGVLALLVISVIGVEIFLQSYLEKTITSRVTDAVGDRYNFKIDGVELSLWQREMSIPNLQVSPAAGMEDSVHIKAANIATIEVDGIGLIPYLWNRSLQFGSIIINQPQLTLNGHLNRYTIQQNSGTNSKMGKNIPHISIERLEIRGGLAELTQPGDSNRKAGIASLHLELRKVSIDSSTFTRPPFVSYSSLQVKGRDLYYKTPEEYYDITLAAFELSSKDSALALDSLSVTPRFPKYNFSQRFGHETDRIELSIPQIRFRKLEIPKLFRKQFRAGWLWVDDMEMELFHDKRMPFPPRSHRPLPHRALQEVPFIIDLDSVSVESGDIAYTEHLPGISETGTVSFRNLNASIYNLSNDTTGQLSEREMVLDASTSFMGQAPLRVKATFPRDNLGYYTVEGDLGSLPMPELNPVLEPLAFVSISSGTIHSLEFDMELATDSARGRVLLDYSDLEISLLDPEKVKKNNEQKLISFLANTFKIKKENSPPLREGTVSFERDPQKSTFNYWWKSLLSGLKSSVGL